jgi:hypothetical protein
MFDNSDLMLPTNDLSSYNEVPEKTGFPVTSDPEAGTSDRQADHCGAVQGDRAHAKETWIQARLGQERAAPA